MNTKLKEWLNKHYLIFTSMRILWCRKGQLIIHQGFLNGKNYLGELSIDPSMGSPLITIVVSRSGLMTLHWDPLNRTYNLDEVQLVKPFSGSFSIRALFLRKG
jgi:hypothetical protein